MKHEYPQPFARNYESLLKRMKLRGMQLRERKAKRAKRAKRGRYPTLFSLSDVMRYPGKYSSAQSWHSWIVIESNNKGQRPLFTSLKFPATNHHGLVPNPAVTCWNYKPKAPSIGETRGYQIFPVESTDERICKSRCGNAISILFSQNNLVIAKCKSLMILDFWLTFFTTHLRVYLSPSTQLQNNFFQAYAKHTLLYTDTHQHEQEEYFPKPQWNKLSENGKAWQVRCYR